MKKMEFREVRNFENGVVEFRGEYIPLKNDINGNEINCMIRNYLKSHKCNNMLENVTALRTILSDCQEKLLVISYEDEKCKETVKYDYTKLFYFEMSKKCATKFENDKYTLKYDSDSGIDIEYYSDEDILEYSKVQDFTKEIKSIMEHIKMISNAKSVTLFDEDKELIEIYKLFYKENPDFSSKDINVKVQTMMSILAEFGITLDFDYAFCLWAKVKMPVSLKIEEMVHKMYPLGLVNEVKDNVKLAEEPKKIIKIVGDSIRDVIHDEDDMNEALITISKVIHASGYNLSSDANVSEIAEFTNRSVDEVEASRQLVKRIEHKINKEN